MEAHLIKERVVGALSGAGFFDGVATHHLHDRVQLTAQQLACLQHVYTHLYTHIHTVSVYTCTITEMQNVKKKDIASELGRDGIVHV